ncbi:MAG TPA: double-strand break repair protein AddB [Thermohalobaculum sp.]|nr:double-strand break repair protein AddB [Thermohalobaculum sp.]
MSRPRLYALPPGAQFAEAFARGFRARLAGLAPEGRARATVLVNTRRSQRAIEEALAADAGGPALLPRMRLLAELGADPLAEPDLAPAVDPLRRRLRLTRLVERYLAATEGAAAQAAAPELADALARLLDELQEEGVDAAALDGLAPEGMARHWQRTLAYADLVRRAWPEIRAEAEGGALDPKARQRAVIERLAARWRDAPPGHPVIAAASTGSVASTAELLAAIARQPRGAVVLPGFDPDLPDEIWHCLAAEPPGSPDHPMAPFVRLFRLLGAHPADVRPWVEEPVPGPRLRLLTQALRPAPVSDAWAAAAPQLAAEADAATADMTLIEAENQRVEAGAIALAIRRALGDPERRIALVTPDATLARRVAAELARFDVVPDDSLGRPLAQTPAGIFFRQVAALAEGAAGPVAVAALIQHPLTRPGMARRDHRSHARRYERKVLRARPQPDRPAGTLPAWDEKATAEQKAWRAAIEGALAPLAAAMAGGTRAGIVAAHGAAAEALSRERGEAEPAVWQGDDGEALGRLVARLAAAADAYGAAPVPDWPGLLATLMQGEQVRLAPTRPHPRVAIWGTMEARTQAADTVILAGLNEGTWPPAPAADPWLSRPMRAALGLAPPERAIGLSAHDFLQAAVKPQAILTRSTRIEGTPTVASRWLLRLRNLMGGLDDGAALDAMRRRGDDLIGMTALIHRPGMPVDPAERPRPCPAPAVRPRKLSVTQIERLIRDAYAVYALKVLGLKPLDPLGRPASYRDRGVVIHEIVQRFIAATEDGLPSDAEARALLLRIAEEVLAREIPWPDTRRIWLGRVTRFADWLVETEHTRRQEGRPLVSEAPGSMVLDIGGAAFEITARADRIDLLHDGTAAVYDYKAGRPPSPKTMKAGFSHQLPLQAAMLMAGGFDGIAPAEVDIGAYIGLTGSGDGGLETKSVGLAADRPAYRERLVRLLGAYLDAGTPFLSRGGVERLDEEGDYDHLARRSEWEGADR